MWVSNARVEVLPGALMKIQVVWCVTLCHWASSSCNLNDCNAQAFQEDEVTVTFECQELLPNDTVTNQKPLLWALFVSCQVTVFIFFLCALQQLFWSNVDVCLWRISRLHFH
jgi:hypothetical protein